MTTFELKSIAADMRAAHGPDHNRHEMWKAIADLVENTRCSLFCGDDGMRWPYCSLCEDSTGDHECPDREPCTHTGTYRSVVAVATAYRDADPS